MAKGTKRGDKGKTVFTINPFPEISYYKRLSTHAKVEVGLNRDKDGLYYFINALHESDNDSVSTLTLRHSKLSVSHAFNIDNSPNHTRLSALADFHFKDKHIMLKNVSLRTRYPVAKGVLVATFTSRNTPKFLYAILSSNPRKSFGKMSVSYAQRVHDWDSAVMFKCHLFPSGNTLNDSRWSVVDKVLKKPIIKVGTRRQISPVDVHLATTLSLPELKFEGTVFYPFNYFTAFIGAKIGTKHRRPELDVGISFNFSA